MVSSAGHLADESWELSDGSYGCLMFGYGWPQNCYAQKFSSPKNHRTLDALAWALIQRLGRSASLEASADGKAPKHPSEISPGPHFF